MERHQIPNALENFQKVDTQGMGNCIKTPLRQKNLIIRMGKILKPF